MMYKGVKRNTKEWRSYRWKGNVKWIIEGCEEVIGKN